MKEIIIKTIKCACVGLLVLTIFCVGIFVHDITSGDMTSKKYITKIIRENKEIINAAVYTIYSSNIVGIYDTKDRELPEGAGDIEGKYVVIDTGERNEYLEPTYIYEPLTDEYLIAMLNIDKLKSVGIDGAIINLYFGGRGIAPSGVCSGVYYFPNDDIKDAKSKYKEEFEQSGEGWLCKPKSGYDSLYVERICDNLWYYEEKW